MSLQQPGSNLTAAWQQLGNSLAAAWQQPGSSLAAADQLRDRCGTAAGTAAEQLRSKGAK